MRVENLKKQESVVESVLFTMGQSVEIRQLAAALESDEETAIQAVERLKEKYDKRKAGMQIVRLDDSYQMCSRTDYYEHLIRVAATPKKQVLSDVVMETLAIILLATPVLLPVMTAFGVDPIHFGVVLVCCCGVGFSTPPLGENIFIASGIADTTLEDISYSALPFVFVTVGIIILCVFVPDIVLFLPRMIY